MLPNERKPGTTGVPRRRDAVCCRVLDGEAVLYDPAHHSMHYLNATAHFVWSRCDGRQGVSDLSRAVAEAFDLGDHGGEAVVEDVCCTLRRLSDDGLVDLCSGMSDDPTGGN